MSDFGSYDASLQEHATTGHLHAFNGMDLLTLLGACAHRHDQLELIHIKKRQARLLGSATIKFAGFKLF